MRFLASITITMVLVIATACSHSQGDTEQTEPDDSNRIRVKTIADTDIFVAVKYGNLGRVKKLLKWKSSLVELENSKREQPLHIAAIHGRLDIARLLIESGSDTNARAKWRVTPLQYAILNDNVIMAYLLVKNGAETNETDRDGVALIEIAAKKGFNDLAIFMVQKIKWIESGRETPLHWVARKGYLNLARILILRGADVNKLNQSGYESPLYCAVREGHTELVKLLIANGADVNWKTKLNENYLHYTISERHTDILKLLISKGLDVNAKSKHGTTPLLNASYWNLKGMEILIAHGAKVNVTDYTGDTPLHRAPNMYEKSGERVKLLLDHGANINARDNHGKTPLHRSYRSYESTQVLIEQGANILAKDNYGNIPLHSAAHAGNLKSVDRKVKIIKLLIQAGSPVNARNKEGKTPLHMTTCGLDECEAGCDYRDAAINVLFENGAELEAKDNLKRTPLFSAFSCSRQEGIYNAKELLALGADISWKDVDGNTLLHAGAATDYYGSSALAFLLDQGFDVNARNKRGRTPLHTAAGTYSSVDNVKLLLKFGADVNARDNEGNTPIHLAALNQDHRHMELLVEHKADINSRNNNGYTPLHFSACDWNYQKLNKLIKYGADIKVAAKDGTTMLHCLSAGGFYDHVEMLIQEGADVNAKNAEGFTPLHYAAGKGCGLIEWRGPWRIREKDSWARKEVVKLLLAKGADAKAKSKKGKTPLSLAYIELKSLEKEFKKVNNRHNMANINGQKDIIALLKKK